MNKIPLPEDLANKKIILCKEEPTFVSPEGEGPWTGRLCAWARVSTCNLSCAWQNPDGSVTLCDTPYTSHKPSRHVVNAQHIYDFVMDAKTHYVSFSGGEPSSQKALIDLIDFVEVSGKRVKIETNGTQFFASKASLISMSPKLKSSGAGLVALANADFKQQDTNNFLNTSDFELRSRQYKTLIERHESKRYNLDAMKQFLDFYGDRVIFKFVANGESDIDEIISQYVEPLQIHPTQVWLMPQGISSEQLNSRAQYTIEVCKRYGWQYSDRLHIRIYGNKTGV